MIVREYNEVYLSGHTTTYCDGEKHVTIPGGQSNQRPNVTLWHKWREYNCDCKAWGNHDRKS